MVYCFVFLFFVELMTVRNSLPFQKHHYYLIFFELVAFLVQTKNELYD